MGRWLGKKCILGSCCVAALMTAIGCQTGTGTKSQRPMAKGGSSPNAFGGREAVATQQRSAQPLGSSQSPLMGAQFPGPNPTGMGGSLGGTPMQMPSGMATSGPGQTGMGAGPSSGLMQTGFSSQMPSAGVLPPLDKTLPMNSGAPSLTNPPLGSPNNFGAPNNFGSPGSSSIRNTASPMPGEIGMPPPVAPTPGSTYPR